MELFFNKKNPERMKFVSEVAIIFTNNPNITSLWNASKFEIRVPTKNFNSKEEFIKKATNFFNERAYVIRPHDSGVQGDKDRIYINFIYPPWNTANKEFCNIYVIWVDDYKKYAKQV